MDKRKPTRKELMYLNLLGTRLQVEGIDKFRHLRGHEFPTVEIDGVVFDEISDLPEDVVNKFLTNNKGDLK